MKDGVWYGVWMCRRVGARTYIQKTQKSCRTPYSIDSPLSLRPDIISQVSVRELLINGGEGSSTRSKVVLRTKDAIHPGIRFLCV
jgi:hypothetical protein